MCLTEGPCVQSLFQSVGLFIFETHLLSAVDIFLNYLFHHFLLFIISALFLEIQLINVGLHALIL